MFLLQLLFYFFIAVFILQIAYYLVFLIGFATKKTVQKSLKKIPISVIICAKNEAENLRANIPLIANQDYANFEIVLVNDDSSDDSLDVMKSLKSHHSNIHIVNVKSIDRFWGNKKYALTLGIKAASNDFLLFTDADCKPNSLSWISQMSSHFSNEKSIVLGYGAYEKVKFSILNKLIRFETLITALQYFSYAKLGMPYMGVGRNMAYRKELFFNSGGYNNHLTIKSGDDDLFINEIATKSNTAISTDVNSFTLSKPKTSFKAWLIQKRRHITTARHYKWKHKLLLSIFYISQISFWVTGIILLSNLFLWEWVVTFVTLRSILYTITIYNTSKKLNELDLVIWSPLLELFLIGFQFCIFIANLISKPNHWK